ncbi:hypothetical protein [Pseudoalteromonas sp. PS5]|uniref:hypothetical protein n=1 Tax=Pseudoalteromonas sp. PS5 TaxID=1437473 RepID=UPI000FFE8DB6|nr:hypothetical protein [Pseudoalteromonas sp. PS5]RXF00397.1 hypothetical protein D9603_15235 [Pseudoalteromonas sp. PS5]
MSDVYENNNSCYQSLHKQERLQEYQLEQKSEIVSKVMFTIIIAAVFVISFAIIFYLTGFDSFLPRSSDAKDFESLRAQYGAFGDFFGGTLNPLLTFFTIVLLVCSLWLQSGELKATRIELQRTRQSQEEQSYEAKLQNQITREQTEAINRQVTVQTNSTNAAKLHYLIDIIRGSESEIETALNTMCGEYPFRQVIKERKNYAKRSSRPRPGLSSSISEVIIRLEDQILLKHETLQVMLTNHMQEDLTGVIAKRVIQETIDQVKRHSLFKNDNREQFISLMNSCKVHLASFKSTHLKESIDNLVVELECNGRP